MQHVPAPRRSGTPAAVLVAILVLVSLARPAGAQVEITVDPAMAKGPVGAPVTILEFSDYQ